MDEKTYLGDGLEAGFDGLHIVLTTRTDTVYLDPNVYAALVRFAEANGFGA